MVSIHLPTLQTAATFGALGMALMAMFIRMRATTKPITERKIIIPPMGMSTGFLMFVVPAMRIPLLWAVVAFIAGACVFAAPLIWSTRFRLEGGQVFLVKSKQFAFILLGLLALRLLLHSYIEHYITIAQTGAVFFVLAFGMILPWRVGMLVKYRRLVGEAPGAKL